MKSRLVSALSLFLILFVAPGIMGQSPSDSTATSADRLRDTIEQLEKTELNSRSATVQDVYRRTLIRLYAQFSKAIEADISDLKKIEATIRGTQSESTGEIAAQLQKLTLERDVVNEKLKTLTDGPDSVSVKLSRESQPMTAAPAPAPLFVPQPPPAAAATGVSAAAVPLTANNATAAAEADPCPNATPIVITGNVKITNDSGSENAKGARIVFSNIKSNGDTVAQPWATTKADGTYSINVKADPACQYVMKASVGDSSVEAPYITGTNTVDLELVVRPLGEFSRAIVGLEQAGASSAKSTQRFFMDLSLSAPLPWGRIDPFFGRRARSWGSVRITSVPQQITTGVAEFAGAFAQKVGEVKVNELAQGVEFLAGGEFRLAGRETSSHFGSFGRDTSTRFSLSFIVGGGIITPFNPRDTLEVFKVFRDAPSFPPGVPAGKDFIAFVSPDRDRFFRQYYGGVRLQTYYFDYDNPTLPLKRYPATLDITYGQNEAVTGGRLRGGVIRLEGFYPLPYEGLKFINLFGTALIKPARTRITDPLILEAAPSGTTVPANNVFLLTVPQINRDYYRVGVGIDLMSLISKWRAAAH